MQVPFGDLKREMVEMGDEIRIAIDRTLESGWFILGSELAAFEAAFANHLGDNVHAVGVASGTEAIQLALMAAGVGHGDVVVTVPNTAVPTASAITAAGATFILADVLPDTLLMDPESLRAALSAHKPRLGERLKAVVPVHLYGQCCDMDAILEVCREFDVACIEDACQAHGATYKGRTAGTMGDFGAFSFYPSKNLGAYGDGGAVVTKDGGRADHLKMLRNYGQSKRYHHDIKGINSRLDEMQSAILSAKLPHLPAWVERRRAIAAQYSEGICVAGMILPTSAACGDPSWHLYVVRHEDREGLMERLAARGVQTLIHYPIPLHLQKAYLDLEIPRGSLPVAETAADQIVSLPMFPQLTEAEVAHVIASVNECA